MSWQMGTVTSISPYKVKPDGSTSALIVSAIAGAVPAVNDRVLWARVGRIIVVMTFDWTAW